MVSKTNIQKFFGEKTVFITGGTGFVGSLLIEKLLRSCPDIGKIYVLIRDKWNVSSETRFEELFKSPAYDTLKKENIEQLKKVFFLKGSFEVEKLGLSEHDWNIIVEEVQCIFHVGASVKFVNPLRNALMSNVFGTHQMILLAKEVKNLHAFVYVSTAYSQCTKSTVEEFFYESPVTSESLLLLTKTLGAKFDQIESTFVGKFPNTYNYSKFVAEDLLRRTAHDLPLTIVRPTIVSQTWKEPLTGWSDHLHSLARCMACYSLGMIHIVPANPTNVFDIIPADYVVNNIIAAAWDAGTHREDKEKHVQIYNCATSHQNPLTHREYDDLSAKYNALYPSNQKVWANFSILTLSKFWKMFFYYLHLPQMFLFDIGMSLLGKSPRYTNLYKKMHVRINIIAFFITNTWLFKTDNTQRLWNTLDENDKKLFNFDIDAIDWDSVIHTYIKHLRVYTLKESPATLPQALRRSRILKVLNYVTIFIVLYLVYHLLKIVFNL